MIKTSRMAENKFGTLESGNMYFCLIGKTHTLQVFKNCIFVIPCFGVVGVVFFFLGGRLLNNCCK